MGLVAPEFGPLPAIVACGTNVSQYDPAFGRAICGRVARGESLRAICAEPGMPHRTTLAGWRRAAPEFAAELAAAQRTVRLAARAVDAGRAEARAWRRALVGPRRGGSASRYDRALGEAICRQIAAGRSLTSICAAPGMPCTVTVYNWIKRHAEFCEMYVEARRIQADVKFDQAWDVAEAATPETVQVARLKFDVIRWQAALLAPKKYAEPMRLRDPALGAPVTVVIRRFSDDAPPAETLTRED